MTAKQQLMTSTTLPLDLLRIDDKTNVRKIDRSVDPVLLASIKALGVIDPLHVRPNGKGYVVHAGGQRLLALQALAKAGDLAADAPVPVIIDNADDAVAREISLAENVARRAMHPVDEFRAFVALNADKEKPLDVDALAERFGITAKIVHQRLALGALDDAILNAWRDGQIKEDAAQAFTLTADKKLQARTLKRLIETGWKGTQVDADDVKEALNVNPNDMGRFINTVGAEAYEARGGKVTRDLFGNDHTVSDEALLKQMVEEKLAETCKQLIADSWGWATSDVPERTWEFGTIQGQFKPTPEEKKQLDAFAKRAEDESLNYQENEAAEEAGQNLKSQIMLRSYSAKQKAKAGCFVRVGSDGTITIEYGKTVPEKVKVETVETVDEETGETIKQTTLGKKKPAKGKSAPKGPAQLTKALIDRLDEQYQTAIQAALTAHPHKDPLARLLAGIAADQIKPGSWNSAPFSDEFDKIANTIAPKVMNAAMRKAFDAKGYFEGCGKAFGLAAITEAVNADEARKVSGKKRGEIAAFALANVGKTLWLPKELRTAHYDGPQGKAKGKTKPAAKAKKK